MIAAEHPALQPRMGPCPEDLNRQNDVGGSLNRVVGTDSECQLDRGPDGDSDDLFDVTEEVAPATNCRKRVGEARLDGRAGQRTHPLAVVDILCTARRIEYPSRLAHEQRSKLILKSTGSAQDISLARP